MKGALKASDFDNEYHLNAHLTPVLTGLFECGPFVLVNTEHWQWLQLEDISSNLDLKPDFIVCHKSCYSKKELKETVREELKAYHDLASKQGIVLRFGVLTSWVLRDTIRVLEAKLKINDEAVGKMIVYLTNVCRDRPNAVAKGMLYDVEGFALMTTDLSSLLHVYQGKWTDQGIYVA